MSNFANIPLGYKIPSQIPLDAKTYVQNEELLKDLGVGNQLAFTYYKGLEIKCIDENTKYIWDEVTLQNDGSGLITINFQYPSNHIVFGIDYSNKEYNFFQKVDLQVDGSETKLQNGTNTTITGLGTIASPYSVNVDIPAVEEQVLEKKDEGNGLGIFLKGRDAAYYGNIGLNAVDFSFSDQVSSVNGATGNFSLSSGRRNIAAGISSVALGEYNEVFGRGSFAEGSNHTIESEYSHAEGFWNEIGPNAHWSHVEGTGTGAFAEGAHAEGVYTDAEGNASHSEGESTTAVGHASHAQNYKTYAQGDYSHAEGSDTISYGNSSHAGGVQTNAYSLAETSIGMFSTYSTGNISTFVPTDKIFNIGNGVSDANRSDAFTILKNGLATLPSVTTALISAASNKAIVTKEYLESLDNLQKVITGSYTVTSADNNHTIFINNGATAVTITVPTGLLAKLNVGFVQQGTGLVSFVASGTTINTPTGLKIKGQNYQAYLEKVGSTEVFHLLGNVIA